MKDRGYPFIVAWGNMLGSSVSYIQEQCDAAYDDKAPENAIYKREGGQWETTDGITSQSTRFTLGLPLLSPVAPALIDQHRGKIIKKETASGKDNFLYTIQFPTIGAAVAWLRNAQQDQATLLAPPSRRLLFDEPVLVEYMLNP